MSLLNSSGTFGALRIDPATNPAVLATETWNPTAAAGHIGALGSATLEACAQAMSDEPVPWSEAGLILHPGSVVRGRGATLALAELPDGQHVLLEIRRSGAEAFLPPPILAVPLSGDETLGVHATDASLLHGAMRAVAPSKLPRALGRVPRLGVGVRMTTACWPGVFAAMDAGGFAANVIQNSVRELNFLSDLLEGRPADRNYASGFGMIEAGYTGSTFEGLWTVGAIEALKHPAPLALGADADHVQVKRGRDGMARAKRYLDSCRYHSFFTVDMADILDYGALREASSAVAGDLARAVVASDGAYREVHAWHRSRRLAGQPLDDGLVDRMIGKYWGAFDALEEVDRYLRGMRAGEEYDLEFTIDEHPPEVPAFDCLTSDEECFFVVNEIARRAVPVTHIAPNTGTEKGFDYRGADGLAGFEHRVASLARIAAEGGVLIDIHSADDLTELARAAIRRATGGTLHYKVSPMLQIIFASVLEDVHPELFGEWWADAVAYATEEAAGSPFAARCLDELSTKADAAPSHRDAVFHHYGFRFVGRRDPQGQFLHRERFYTLSPEFYALHEERIRAYVLGLAHDLFA